MIIFTIWDILLLVLSLHSTWKLMPEDLKEGLGAPIGFIIMGGICAIWLILVILCDYHLIIGEPK